jgi:hypothetical protein
MKILLVLMCYINHLSGYISYFDTEYWFIFFQYAENLKMKSAWKQRMLWLPPSFCLPYNLREKTVFRLPGSWIPLLFLNDEEYDWGIASNSGMNELPGYLGLGGGDVERGSESGILNFILWRKSSLSSFGRRCYLFTSQCSYYSVFFSIQYLFCFA